MSDTTQNPQQQPQTNPNQVQQTAPQQQPVQNIPQQPVYAAQAGTVANPVAPPIPPQQAPAQTGGAYSYTDDEDAMTSSGGGGLTFGLMAGVAFMTKFEFIKNGGKDGAEGEAIDIIFNVNGVDKSYRRFPVTKAYIPATDGGGETTDVNHPAMQEEFKNFNAIMTHILGVFVDKEHIKIAFGVPITSFEQYANIARSLLPANFAEIPLDIFAHYQWSIKGEATKTYLQLPTKMKYGRWLQKAQVPVGTWHEVKKDSPVDGDANALTYVDDAGNIHNFKRNGWFMNSKYATQQVEDLGGTINSNPNMHQTGGAYQAPNAQGQPLPPVGPEGAAPAGGGW